jgi:ribosome-associated heat shock protein Hsp15
MTDISSMRLDKWLWSARFYKTRSLAAEDIGKGRVQVNGALAKASRDLRPGDRITLQQAYLRKEVVVQSLSMQRGPASQAQQLYAETQASLQAREKAAEQRRLAPEPAQTLAQGRPTKRDRRDIQQIHDWNDRWSASINDG